MWLAAVPAFTLSSMDKVRFGRALGFGARQAGKAFLQAADAALKPDPNQAHPAPNRPAPSRPVPSRPTPSQAGTRVARKAVVYKREGKRFGQAMWGPVARASGILWLELTGVFFGLFAMTAGIELYRHFNDFTVTGAPRRRIWFAAGMLVLFGWFTISSFLRAHQRSRRHLQG